MKLFSTIPKPAMRPILSAAAIFLLVTSTTSCSLLSRMGIGRDSQSPRAIARDLPAATQETATSLELGTLLRSTAEDRRVLTDPVARKFPNNAGGERAGIQKNWSDASRLYGETLRRLSKLNSGATAQAIQQQKTAAKGSTAKTQVLDLISIHQSRLRGGNKLTAAEWEQDYRTLFYRQPANQDPAATRSTRILLGE